MNNNINISKIIRSKKNQMLFSRNLNTYKFKTVSDYNKLTPYTYTVLLKDTIVITVIDGKRENTLKLKRGDYVLCGSKKEKYGLPLEKVLNTYDVGDIKNKKVIRKGIKLTKKIMKNKKNIDIVASWGGKQSLHLGDYILLEFDNKGYYGINKEAFKKTYKKL